MRSLTFFLCSFLILTLSSTESQAQEDVYPPFTLIQVEDEMTFHEFEETYNICWEYLGLYIDFYENQTASFTFVLEPENYYFPPYIPPCYNEDGQRLVFDEHGESPAEATYQDVEMYITSAIENFEEVSMETNVCTEIILEHNPIFKYRGTSFLLSNWVFAEGIPIALPVDTRPCYNKDGDLIRYLEDGSEEILDAGDLHVINPEDELNIDLLAYANGTCADTITESNYLSEIDDTDLITIRVVPEGISCR